MQRTQLWIGGKWVPGAQTVTLKNPHTGEAIAEIDYASVEQAETAIEAAHAAFTSFQGTPAHRRAEILYRAAERLQARLEEAARIIAAEGAKPIVAARAEMERTIQTYQFAAEAAKAVHGTTVPMDAAPRGERHTAYVIKRPIGVVSAITPFNFPFNLVAHKVGPAIAAGNTIVLKPAEQTPLSALFLADVFREAGLPDGVLNIIPGYGHELGEVLSTHRHVAFVTFTGSPRVGKIIRAQAGLRKVTLELGSNSPLLVDEGFSEAELDRIVAETAGGAFSYNGQVCISIQRVYVHQSQFESFTEKLAARAAQLRVGDPMDESTDISALINEAAANRLKGWLNHAVLRGAKVRTGGKFDGSIMYPTVLTDVPTDVELNCEEAFGPVVTVTPFDTWTQAIEMANNSKFGLNAGVFTKNIERAFQAAERLETGGVLINQIPTFRVDQMPYGGIKESGSGREGVQYAMEDMMEVKMVAFRTGVFAE
ncbi:aldehyde dehydrogenase family protein [Alicyclobacillus cycloheptanicus]|uniref:Acyl-CoA reductase-like NAD-dependent aldehyde dehydrogenase n=1 Tax=Alicyclobacillus cycloheptanicus TaxID=1457 RepID=A0ABT9XIR2_9BACL|nr:aldehyde dehydrogenase family protein [Alicyclobacillus cycloheptanicus]MDQ0190191.1 acyl-CoA reductase-like NAD-dependent aldehyde dehydrogenase [Alicyclobacillus cycloheptanicus]WDM02559.1 aldehyde dehydrogenase family protein [Alicyclobacillus cycloheptanicus]